MQRHTQGVQTVQKNDLNQWKQITIYTSCANEGFAIFTFICFQTFLSKCLLQNVWALMQIYANKFLIK